MIWRVIVGLLLAICAAGRPLQETGSVGKLCRMGNVSLPLGIFEAYVGWECYETTFAAAKRLAVRICMERSGNLDYSVPCFKSGRKLLTFNLKNEETVSEVAKRFESESLNDQMIRCFLRVVGDCETSSDGWLLNGGRPRFWMPNVTAEVICAKSARSKFHVAMLSISMIVGIPIAAIFVYSSWANQNPTLTHCKNLITALVLRTLFTILIETEIVAKRVDFAEGDFMSNWPGCEALVTFEAISLNLVLAFWLILTIHVLEYTKNGLERQPNVFAGSCIIGGLALAFAIIWIIIMAAGEYPNCWLDRTSLQWVNDSLRLSFLLLQVFLIAVVVFRFQTDLKDHETDEAQLMRKLSLYILVLSPLFLLQFSLAAGQPVDGANEDAYFYTEYFFDGLQCAAVSIFFIFLGDIRRFILDSLGIGKRKQCHRVFETMGAKEIHSDILSTPKFAATANETEQQKDVAYSSVLTPERFEKMIMLYNRLNAIPKRNFGEEHPAQRRISSVRSEHLDADSESAKSSIPVADPGDQPKRSGTKDFYHSKYLIDDSTSSDSEDSEECENCTIQQREDGGATAEETHSQESFDIPSAGATNSAVCATKALC